MDETMERSNDDMMDVDTDGASGIIDMELSTQPNEQNEENNEGKLTDLPKEMLEEILIHLDDDEDMLTASHVCKSFAPAAETAFARKYANKRYCIDGSFQDIEFDKVMLSKYGEKMRRIEINGVDEEILDLVEQKCGNLKSISLTDVSGIVMLKNLKEVFIRLVDNWNHETFREFIYMNPHLETLNLMDQLEIDFTDILHGRLNVLKKFELMIGNIIGLPREIRLDSLETLWLELADSESYVRILRAMNCNKIKTLELNYGEDQNQDVDVITEVCNFESLVSLDLFYYRITSDEVRKLAAHLPHLAELKVEMAKDQSNPENMIQSMISMLPKLTKFTVSLDEDDFDQLVIELKKSPKEFHARFARSNIEIVLIGASHVSITTDYFCIHGGGSIELHWMNNLSEKSVRLQDIASD